MTNRVKFGSALLTVLITATAVLLLRLPRTPLTNWDEGIYAEVTRTMHSGGSWWLPTYHGQLFLEKPPLTFWLMDLSFKMFGANELGVRFWSAFAGVLTAGLITVWTWQLRKKSLVALLAGLIFVSGRFIFFHAFRTGDTDGLLVLFMTLALYSYWKTRENQHWWWSIGLATGLAVMTKSFIGLLPSAIILLDVWLSGRDRKISWRRAMEGLGLLLLVAAPWHLAVAIHHGSELWHQAIGFNLVERSSATIASLKAPWWWYGQVILNFFFPWSIFVPLGILLAVRRWLNGDSISRTLVLWPVVVFIVFAFAATKYDHYIQPLYPALAIMLALMIEELWSARSSWRLAGIILSLAGLIFSFPPRLAHQGLLWRLTPYAWLPARFGQGNGQRLLVAVMVTVVLGGLSWLIARRIRQSPERVMLVALIPYLLILSLGWQYSYLKHLPTTSNAKAIAIKLATVHPNNVDIIGISHLSEPALYFYVARINGLVVREVPKTVDAQSTTVITTSSLASSLQSAGYQPVTQQGPYSILTR